MNDAVEQASEADRIWFRRNPHRQFRLRKQVPGEFETGEIGKDGMSGVVLPRGYPGTEDDFIRAVMSTGEYTLVQQLTAGARSRMSINARPMRRSDLRRLTDADIRAMVFD